MYIYIWYYMIIYRFIYMSIWPHVSSCFSFRQVTPWKPHPRASAAPPPRAVGTWSQWPHRPWAPHQWRGETATVASGRIWWPAQQEMATGKWGTLTSWPGKLGVFKAKMLGKWSDSEGGWVWKLFFLENLQIEWSFHESNIIWLVVEPPLWIILVSWDDDIPNVWKKNVPNHQPVIINPIPSL